MADDRAARSALPNVAAGARVSLLVVELPRPSRKSSPMRLPPLRVAAVLVAVLDRGAGVELARGAGVRSGRDRSRGAVVGAGAGRAARVGCGRG
jgi:hypothetical protein